MYKGAEPIEKKGEQEHSGGPAPHKKGIIARIKKFLFGEEKKSVGNKSHEDHSTERKLSSGKSPHSDERQSTREKSSAKGKGSAEHEEGHQKQNEKDEKKPSKPQEDLNLIRIFKKLLGIKDKEKKAPSQEEHPSQEKSPPGKYRDEKGPSSPDKAKDKEHGKEEGDKENPNNPKEKDDGEKKSPLSKKEIAAVVLTAIFAPHVAIILVIGLLVKKVIEKGIDRYRSWKGKREQKQGKQGSPNQNERSKEAEHNRSQSQEQERKQVVNRDAPHKAAAHDDHMKGAAAQEGHKHNLKVTEHKGVEEPSKGRANVEALRFARTPQASIIVQGMKRRSVAIEHNTVSPPSTPRGRDTVRAPAKVAVATH